MKYVIKKTWVGILMLCLLVSPTDILANTPTNNSEKEDVVSTSIAGVDEVGIEEQENAQAHKFTANCLITPGKLTVGGPITFSLFGPGVVQSAPNGVLSSTNGTNGQLLIGGGSGPQWANLTSSDNSVQITNGPNSIDLVAIGGGGGGGIVFLDADNGQHAGTAVVTVTGGGAGSNITTFGDNFDTLTIKVTGTTPNAVQVGSATGSLSSVPAAATGTLLQSNGASAPTWTTSEYPTASNSTGDIMYGSNTDQLSFLPIDGTPTRYLANTGAGGTQPAWNQVNLTNGVTGTLSVASGGTNATSFTNSNGTIYFDGTRLTTVSPGSTAQVLTSNGPLLPPSYQDISISGVVTAVLPGTNISVDNTNPATPVVSVVNNPTFSGLVTANAGLTATGGTTSITGTTNINTSGSSTTTIGNNLSTTTVNGGLMVANGETITSGTLTIPAGSTATPSLSFAGSATTGLSANSNTLSFSTSGQERMKISSGGTVAIDQFVTAGVVHNDTGGNLSTSLIVNADVSNTAAITDTKLATISTAGKVANSATTATSANTPNAIVTRDGAGDFSAGTITANLTGAASLNVLKAGDTMTGNLTMATQNAVRFQDNSASLNFVGLNAPVSVANSYTLSLPSTTPLAHQDLRANATTPTNLEWYTPSSSILPTTSKTIYVTTYGNDITGDGSYSSPYASLSKAVSVANTLSSASTPVVITMGPGTYSENNNAGPITITASDISIVGDSLNSVIITPQSNTQNLIATTTTAAFQNLNFQTFGLSSAAAISIGAAANSSNLTQVTIFGFQTGIICSGNTTCNACAFENNGTGVNVNNVTAILFDCILYGTVIPGLPANTGLTVTGINGLAVISSCSCLSCATGMSLSNSANLQVQSTIFRSNANSISQTGGTLNLLACDFTPHATATTVNEILIGGMGSSATVSGCTFDNNVGASGTLTAFTVTDQAVVSLSGGQVDSYTTALAIGAPGDTSSTSLTVSNLLITNCTNDIIQQGSSSLNVVAGIADGTKISINDPTHVNLAYFDTAFSNALVIGSNEDAYTNLIQVATNAGVANRPGIDYNPTLYNTQGLGFHNSVNNPSTLFVASTGDDAHVDAITTDRTHATSVRLVSDANYLSGTSQIRGWDITKNNSTNAELSFNFQNADTFNLPLIAQYTVMQLDGVNNQIQVPNSSTHIVFDGDTTLYRTAASTLKTDGNIIVGGLTANRAVATDGNSQLVSSVTTATELGFLSGVTSNVQTQLNSKVNKSGDTMTGTLQLPAGSTASPSLVFTGSTTTGLSANTSNLSFSTSGQERMKISSAGTVSIDAFNTSGVVHNDTSGNLSTSLIVNADISSNTITDDKLQTISTPGKVANSATTATTSNTPNTIVLRDTSGNFSAGTITASFVGNLTGNVTGNVSGSATSFTGSLLGDVTGTQGATVVSFVGGKTAADVANATTTVDAATNLDIPSTLVLRDTTGNFATKMITIDGTVTNPTDVATKEYVDTAVSLGLTVHTPAVVYASSNFTSCCPPSGPATIDGYTVQTGDRILLNGQIDQVFNGVWDANTAGTWTYPADFASGTQIGKAYVLITNGNTYAGSSWVCNTPTATIGTDSVNFVEFAIPSQTTAANVGMGTGQLFQNKVAQTLNFRTLLNSTYITNTTETNEVTISANASSSNIANQLVARNAAGNFSANYISINGMSSGSTIDLLNQSAVNFHDASVSSNFVGIDAPTTVANSYTLSLPSTTPTSHQVIRANSTTPTNLEWYTPSGSILPVTSRTIYVAIFGNDVTGDGSQTSPYASLSKAVSVANTLSTTSNPIVISMGTGTYVEDNSMGPITITAGGISIVGDTVAAVIITPSTLSQDLLAITTTAQLSNFTLQTAGGSTASAVTLSGSGNETNFDTMAITLFNTGIVCGGSNGLYDFSNCFITANGTGIMSSSASFNCSNSIITGSFDITTPANTGVNISGTSTIVISGCIIGACSTGLQVSNNANVTVQSDVFTFNRNSIIQSSGSNITAQSCTLKSSQTVSPIIEFQVSGVGSESSIIGCSFEGGVLAGSGTALQISNQATVLMSGGQIDDYTNGIIIGLPGDTASTNLQASTVTITNCTNDIIQQGSATLSFTGGIFDDTKITINDTTNVSTAYFDTAEGNVLNIGKFADVDTKLINVENGNNIEPTLEYKTVIYASKALGYTNLSNSPATSFVLSNSSANFTAITTDRTQPAMLRLVSDTGGTVGTTTAIRGWDISKTESSAQLAFAYQNSDTIGQQAVAQYIVMQLDGVNNQIQVPNSSTKIVFDSDTNLYRGTANTLKTDGNIIVGGLTANRAVATDNNSQLVSSITTATELGFLSGTTSNVQTQLNSKVNKSGDTMTGTLILPAGTTSSPSLTFHNGIISKRKQLIIKHQWARAHANKFCWYSNC